MINKVDMMGRACCMHERDDTHTKFCKNLKGRDHLEDLQINGRIILKMALWNQSE
jgi:hypothetical protein